MSVDTLVKSNDLKTEDFLPLNGTDHIEFFVGNAKQSAYYYQSAWGYKLVAYAGPETGVRDRTSYVLQQDKVKFIITSSMHPDSEIAKHHQLHGDGVKVLALWVDDATKSFEETVKRGAEAVMEPTKLEDEHAIGLKYVDHCVGNVELGKMNDWVKFYEDVMGFKLLITFDDSDISTEYTALMSKVVSNGNGYVKFPINEPANGKRKSQIEEYIEFYKGGGVQHIAIATDDIVKTVSELRNRGVDFLYVPDNYYDDLLDRVGEIQEDLEPLKANNILVDRDDEGYLLQIFTKPVQDRPTVFYEIIQRRGAKSFGKGNFKALFEAIEREQELRGNL
ncbi:UNVERIFIED_CONTAM: hypothetical protein GTU68_050673 [Idotea baltica]|nr:hypothetical protein [Idotea baltica]